MDGLRSKIAEVLRGPQLASFATVTEDGKPWVRYVVVVADSELTLRFATYASSRKVAQIRRNPEVHLTCGVASLNDSKPYLQIQGRAAVTADDRDRRAFWSDMLAPYFKGPDDPDYVVVLVKPYRVEYMGVGAVSPEVLEP
ncbi:MAG: pyridoxamine 5'-phosphate oxidase family protein [Planctomycetes bacterium]|nr:pyridoxamine 5'-phosphate oxidase family protein [Planctomycetota bacterium]